MSPLEYDSKLEKISTELHELEDNAGISEEGERVREGPFIPLHALDMEPYGTAEGRAQRREEDEYKSDYVRRELRKLYSGVADPTIRKELIRKQRKLESTHLYSVGAEVAEARRNLETAELQAGGSWWLSASIVAVGLVSVGYSIFSIPGALAALLVSCFIGRSYEQSASRSREATIKKLRKELIDWEQTYENVSAQPLTFSAIEERTGVVNNEVDS